MATKLTRLRVVGLHKLPFDQKKFNADLVEIAGPSRTEQDRWREQVRGNWENAWLVVVEFDGEAAELDFDGFNHPDRSRSAQAAWNERVISTTPTRTRAAFYLHYVDPRKPLWYRDERLTFPDPTPAPLADLEAVPYGSPD